MNRERLQFAVAARLGIACLLFLAACHAAAAPPEFRRVEGGRFIQGASGGERVLQLAFPLSTTGQAYGNAEGPAHVTWITKPFYIATTEVTVGQFKQFVKATGYKTSAEQGKSQMVGWEPTPPEKPLYQSYDFLRDAKFNWRNPGFKQTDDHPVVGVSWADAKAYCTWLSKRDGVRYRLPTEAEWELTCRAGTSTWFSFGDKAQGVAHKHGNFGNVELEKHRQHAAERQWLLDWENGPEDGHVFTAPVGSYQANPWGLHDMHGNVWEWCEDLWLDTVYKDFNRPRYDQPTGVAVDPVNTAWPQTSTNEFHVIRGGSWYNGDLFCRSANRMPWDADDAASYIGFRLVREAGPDGPNTARDAYEAEQAAIARVRAAGGMFYSSRGLDIEVRLEGDSFDESALEALARLPDLHRLRVRWRKRGTKLTQAGIDAIAQLTNLHSLEFTSCLDPQAVNLAPLTRLAALEELRFPRDAPFSDEHLRALSGFRSLVEFQCFGTGGGLTDDGISQLAGNRNLQSLLVWETEATGEFLRDFAGCPLTTLACSAMYQGDGELTDTGVQHLAAFPDLTSLTLDGQSQITRPSLKVVGRLTKLQRLSLTRCRGFVDVDFSELQGLQRLRDVNLLGSQAGDVAAAAVANIPRIETARIGGSPSETLTDSGLRDLSQAFSLQEVDVDSNLITDQGIRHIGRINRLRRLTITSNQVTGAGLGPLCRLPSLDELSLRTSGLTDIAFDHLSRAKSVTKLRLAHRGYRPPAGLTDEGLLKMAQATWLKELWLPRNDTGMTEAQMNRLKAMMPKTGVIPYTVTWDR